MFKDSKPVSNEMKAAIRAAYSLVWDSDKMVDYCTNKVSRAIILPDSKIVIWEKQKIETNFCFGESGYDYDDAARMAAYARTNEEYFKRENLRGLTDIISALEGKGKGFYYNSTPYLQEEQYAGHNEGLGLYKLCFFKWADIYRLDSNERNTITPITTEEKALILEGCKAERDAFEKRLISYLKRYGTSKVRAWTYWRDA